MYVCKCMYVNVCMYIMSCHVMWRVFVRLFVCARLLTQNTSCIVLLGLISTRLQQFPCFDAVSGLCYFRRWQCWFTIPACGQPFFVFWALPGQKPESLLDLVPRMKSMHKLFCSFCSDFRRENVGMLGRPGFLALWGLGPRINTDHGSMQSCSTAWLSNVEYENTF